MISSPTVNGALTSILGKDYLFGGGGHMHVSGKQDQSFHKDGTARGVRDHEPHSLIVMYYCTDTTVEMGATCVAPGTQYFSVDREGWLS